MAKYSKTAEPEDGSFAEGFVSKSGLYDVQSPTFYIRNVKAKDSNEAIEKVASEWNVRPSTLEVYEASDPRP